MAESRYFPDLRNSSDMADVEQVEQGFVSVQQDVMSVEEDIKHLSTDIDNINDNVRDIGINKEDIANKVTEITSDDKVYEYPTAPAVRKAIYKTVPKTETTAELPVYLPDALEGENVTKLLAYGTEAGSGDADGEKYKIKINACGKNLFDADSIFLSAPGWTSFYDENGVKTYKGTVPNLFSKYSGGIPLALNNKKLVFSWEARNSSKNSVTTYIKIWYPTYTENVCHIQSTEWTKCSGVSTSNVINKLTFGYSTGDTVYIRNVQIEEATEKSDYEPYSGSTVEAELDEPLLAGEYVDFLRKKHVSGTGESDITVNGRIKAPNSEVCMLWSGDTSKPKNLKIGYYQDINKVISELKNAVLAQGANV